MGVYLCTCTWFLPIENMIQWIFEVRALCPATLDRFTEPFRIWEDGGGDRRRKGLESRISGRCLQTAHLE